MIGAGTVINPIIKIVTTVAILGAAYLFIVKPVLDTTNDTIERSFDAFGSGFEGFDALPVGIQDSIDEALESSDQSSRLQACIRRAVDREQPDTGRVNRCVERFAP